MSDVTEWFPATVKPVRDGLYEVWEYGVGIVGKMTFAFGNWYWPYGELAYISTWNGFKWRGLAEPI